MRYKHRRHRLVARLALYAIADAFAAENDLALLEQIIVTAEKRETSLQDTSISMLAFGSAALDKAGVESTLDLQLISPGVVDEYSSRADLRSRSGHELRRRSQRRLSCGRRLSGVHAGAFQDFLDDERVEILKGPQGTLYGRNATAGVINA